MWGKRKKEGARKRRDSGRICPFCESENDASATTCHQCYYELDVKAMHQSSSPMEVEKDTLWGELLQEVDPSQEEDYSVSVITMDEMTVEVDEYETVGDDEVIIMSEGGPSFAEIMDSEVVDDNTADENEALVAAPVPSIPEIEAVSEIPGIVETQVIENPQVGIVIEESVPLNPGVTPIPPQIPDIAEIPSAPLTPPPVPVISSLDSSEEELDDDLDDIIAAARTVERNQVVSSPPPLPVSLEAAPVVPAPTPSVQNMVPNIQEAAPIPALPTVQETAPLPPPVPNGRMSIWPWPQSEPWDPRELRREIIEAMAAAQKGDRNAATQALDRFGPHLGDRFEALHHVGALLHSIGRTEEMRQMISAAMKQHPDDPNVSTAAAALMQS